MSIFKSISVSGNNCDQWPRAPKNLAAPLNLVTLNIYTVLGCLMLPASVAESTDWITTEVEPTAFKTSVFFFTIWHPRCVHITQRGNNGLDTQHIFCKSKLHVLPTSTQQSSHCTQNYKKEIVYIKVRDKISATQQTSRISCKQSPCYNSVTAWWRLRWGSRNM